MKWFRFYGDAVNDPKVQRLSPKLFKAWVNLLCLACSNKGDLPSALDIGFTLKMSEKRVVLMLEELKRARLLDTQPDNVLTPHNWDGRQYKSDVSNERVQRYRQRQRNVTVTPPDTEQIQSQNTEQKESTPQLPPKGADKRGSHLSKDWWPNDNAVSWTSAQSIDADQLLELVDEFRDYWCAVPGQRGSKTDWDATFRNSVRRFLERRATSPPRLVYSKQPNGQKPRMTKDEALKILRS